jgi:hypothetical protein
MFFTSQVAARSENECVLELSQGSVHVKGDILLVKLGRNSHPSSILDEAVAGILHTAMR